MADSNSSYVHDLVVGLAGAFASQSFGWFRGWLRSRDRVVMDQVALKALEASVARVEAAVKLQSQDLDGVAHALRTRLKILESVFVERTGEMPRLHRDTGEGEASRE